MKLKKNINIVFAGDSNVECAINDSLIPNSINIAESGEAYLYTYVKIKSLLKYNKQIRTIYLGFSYYILSKDIENLWLFSDEWVLEKNSKYNYLMDNPEKYLILKNNPKFYLQGIRDYTFRNFKSIGISYLPNSKNNFGGYKFFNKDNLQENIKKNESIKKTPFHFDEGKYQILYLKLISDLCKKNNVKLILFNTPKHNSLTKSFNYKKNDFGITVKTLLENDSLLDMSTMSLQDSCYGDLVHLNYKGAKIFSEYLNKRIHSHLNKDSL